ncbi:MAG: hypothetical protein NVS3B10_30830 [Polyangiales bacterium]
MRLEANSTVPSPLYGVSAPDLVVVPPSSPYVFFAQKGLAVDDACVYFWASTNNGTVTLNTVPLMRVAPP